MIDLGQVNELYYYKSMLTVFKLLIVRINSNDENLHSVKAWLYCWIYAYIEPMQIKLPWKNATYVEGVVAGMQIVQISYSNEC